MIEAADQVEEQLAAAVGKGQITQLVEDDEIDARELLGQPAGAPRAGLGLQLVDQIHDVEEAATGAVADAVGGDGDSQMRLAGSGAPDQDGVARW